ncbi:MAG: FHA domain-containing protein [candidate division WOR-3 bacterium]
MCYYKFNKKLIFIFSIIFSLNGFSQGLKEINPDDFIIYGKESEDPVEYAKKIIEEQNIFWQPVTYYSILGVYEVGAISAMYGGAYILLESPSLAVSLVSGGFAGLIGDMSKDSLLWILSKSIETPEEVCKELSNQVRKEGLKDYKIAYKIARHFLKTGILSREDAIEFLDRRFGLIKLPIAKKLYNDSISKDYKIDKSISEKLIEETMAKLERELDITGEGKLSIVKSAVFIKELIQILKEKKIGLANYEPYKKFEKSMEELNSLRIEEAKRFTGKPQKSFYTRMWTSDEEETEGIGEGGLKKTSGADLIFVIDATGSMEDDIDAVKDESLNLINQMFSLVPSLRIALVLYRDFDDEWVTKPYPFTESKEEAIEYIKSIEVGGGGDIPEAVHTALITAIRNEGTGKWRDGVLKIIILMGDAPPTPRDKYTAEDVERAAKEVDPAHIFPIIISGADEATKNAFEDLALRTEGKAFETKSASELPIVLLNVTKESIKKTSSAEKIVVVWPKDKKVFPVKEKKEKIRYVWFLYIIEFILLFGIGLIIFIIFKEKRGKAKIYLLAIFPDLSKKKFLFKKKKVKIGRSKKNDFVIEDNSVSREHAIISKEKNFFIIEDLYSQNGTKINGKEISKPTRVDFDDEIKLGDVIIKIFKAKENEL